MQAAAWVGARIVSSFSKIDKQLEEGGILKPLERNPVPEDVLDGKGELIDECAEVRCPCRVSCVMRLPSRMQCAVVVTTDIGCAWFCHTTFPH